MHRDACLSGIHISLRSSGYCSDEKTSTIDDESLFEPGEESWRCFIKNLHIEIKKSKSHDINLEIRNDSKSQYKPVMNICEVYWNLEM